MPIIRGLRLMNALLNGSLTGTQLETLLTTGGRLADWEQVLALPGQANIISRSTVALPIIMSSGAATSAVTRAPTANVQNIMDSVASSSEALTALTGSANAMNAVAASSTAMSIIANSATAMQACYNSQIAKEAFWANNAAAGQIANSSNALAYLRAASAYSVVSFTGGVGGTTPIAITLSGARYLLLGASRASTTLAYVYMNTVRAGFNGITYNYIGATSRTDALSSNSCIPVQSPYSAYFNATNTSTTNYLGLLRVDV